MDSYCVFISYSSKEAGIANQVCEYLEQNGIKCWIAPRNIEPGKNYATQIVQAIRKCKALVLLASKNTNASGHVGNEVSLAFDNNKVIIPFKIEDITFSDEYLYFLGRKHWIEAHADMELGFSQLLSTLISTTGAEISTPTLSPNFSSNNICNAQQENKKEALQDNNGNDHETNSYKSGAMSSNKMSDEYTVMGYEDIIESEGNIELIKEEIVSIVNSVLSSNSDGLKSNLKMLENISENWRVILNKKGELVGYWVFVALQNAIFEQAKSGQLNEAEITLNSLEFIDFPGTYKGYLLLSGVKPNARTAVLVQKLYDSLAHHFESLASNGIFFDEICGVAESPMGESALRKMGMAEIAPCIAGGKVFLGNLVNIKNNRYFSSFPVLKQLYEEYFAGEQH